MPGPLAVPLIAAGAELFGQAGNAVMQGIQNRKARQFAFQMYQQQRADALADWNMQNDYDSPTSQMKRLREAGLNPNLVYGKGADNTSSPVRSSTGGSWNPSAPKFDAGSVIGQYQDTQIRQAQIDNLKTQNTVMVQDGLLKAAQIAALGAQTAQSQFKLDFDRELRSISAEAARLGVEKQRADIDYTLDSNERQAASNAQSLKEGAERILNYRADRARTFMDRQKIIQEIENLKTDGKIKELDRQLREKGIYPGDPGYWRVLGRLVNNIPGVPEGMKQQGAAGKRPSGTTFGAGFGFDIMDLFH